MLLRDCLWLQIIGKEEGEDEEGGEDDEEGEGERTVIAWLRSDSCNFCVINLRLTYCLG